MRIIKTKDYDAMSAAAARIIAAQITLKPDCVLGLATGSSPVGTYQNLIAWNKAGELDFSAVRSVNLDEYAGLNPDHDQSYAYFMRTNLFDHVNIDLKNTNVPSGISGDEECQRYDQLIQAYGGIDLQLLGLGVNGHIGFNEPDDHFSLGTHKVTLTESTREANKRFFTSIDEVPTHAYTMGVRDILQARRVLMVASGENKAQAIKAAFFGPVTPQVPASILQYHKDFILVADEAALSLV
ncbi:MAG: glucosamine-6-phosphate deaminase [Lawsonibacter sp.]